MLLVAAGRGFHHQNDKMIMTHGPDQVGGIALNPLSLVEDLDYASLIMSQGSCSH